MAIAHNKRYIKDIYRIMYLLNRFSICHALLASDKAIWDGSNFIPNPERTTDIYIYDLKL
jgi:hypothetical protein